jgi:Icc-related predicted phosphoesterase
MNDHCPEPDSLFLTDLHGYLSAIPLCLQAARRKGPIRFLILGGDVAPNVFAIRLLDGEYALRHEERWSDEIAARFRSDLRKGRTCLPRRHHGKVSACVRVDLTAAEALALDDDALRGLLEWPAGFEHLRKVQADFVTAELFPLLLRLREEGVSSFCMLGNDDFADLEPILLDEERLRGTLTYIRGRAVPMGSALVAGYTHVLSKPFRYRFWEKSEQEIGFELARLTEGALDPAKLVLSIHMPPANTNLDILEKGRTHAGSSAVRALFETRRFALGLFGHFHEAGRVGVPRHDEINATPLVNPGGFHQEERCGVVFPSQRPGSWQGLWDDVS